MSADIRILRCLEIQKIISKDSEQTRMATLLMMLTTCLKVAPLHVREDLRSDMVRFLSAPMAVLVGDQAPPAFTDQPHHAQKTHYILMGMAKVLSVELDKLDPEQACTIAIGLLGNMFVQVPAAERRAFSDHIWGKLNHCFQVMSDQFPDAPTVEDAELSKASFDESVQCLAKQVPISV